jgi:thiamine-phosphate pyrophosphorylase
VHIGQEDLPVDKVRLHVGEKMIIGVSTHSPHQAQSAVDDGADYIGVGPIFKTYTKKDVCDPVGLDYLDYVVNNIKIPFVVIGGIKLGNITEVVKRGAKCISMITEIVGSGDIEERIRETKEQIKSSRELGSLNQ